MVRFHRGGDVHFRTYVNASPRKDEDCRHGGWRKYGFSNRLLCTVFVRVYVELACRSDLREVFGEATRLLCPTRASVRVR